MGLKGLLIASVLYSPITGIKPSQGICEQN
jgi:hypothetical protein